jgi:hypothetical protein
MDKDQVSPGRQFFGDMVTFKCIINDLKLVLRKTEKIEFPEYHDDESEVLSFNIFPDIARQSFIVTLLIALDAEMKSYCEHLRKITGQKLKSNDLRGSALDKFLSYSEKVCGLQNIYNKPNRELLEGLIEVRNCIVHNNSGLDGFSKPKVIEHFVKQVNGVIISDGYLSFEHKACNACADIVLEFMTHAYKSALEVYPYSN